MAIGDRFFEALDKVVAPARDQTIVDDAQSRLARRQQAERDRIQRVEHDPETGKPLLWFDVTITVGTHTVPLPWSGKDWEDVNDAVIEWLATNEFITLDFSHNGAQRKLTFRASFVAHWEIGAGRTRK